MYEGKRHLIKKGAVESRRNGFLDHAFPEAANEHRVQSLNNASERVGQIWGNAIAWND